MFTQNGANAGLSLVQQGHAFTYRQYLRQSDEWAYLDQEKLAERYCVGVWRLLGGIKRPWDFRAAGRWQWPRHSGINIEFTVTF